MGSIQLFDHLGSGSYGEVYICNYNGAWYAAKIMHVEDACVDVVARDVLLLQYMQSRSDRVCRLHACGILENGAIVMLLDLLSKLAPVTPKHLPHALHELAAATATVHDAGVLHRDISYANVMVNDHGTLVLIDFGLACFRGDGGDDHDRSAAGAAGPASAALGCRDRLSPHVTTIIARAPELVQANGRFAYSTEIDVYSVASTTLRIAGLTTHNVKHPKTNDYHWHVQLPQLGALEDARMDGALKGLLRSMMSDQPADRPSLGAVMAATAAKAGGPSGPPSGPPVFQVKPFVKPTGIPSCRALTEIHFDASTVPAQSACSCHTSFKSHLWTAFSEYIHGHSDCVLERADALATRLCDGFCMRTQAAALVIAWSLHQKFYERSLKELSQWANVPLLELRETVGALLVRAAHVQDSWLLGCTKQTNRCH